MLGSYFVYLVRRLKRVCAHYGSHLTFILCSATIANPGDLARQLVEEDVVLVDDNGAPTSDKHVVFSNPPVVNRQLGIRASSVLTARRPAADLIGNRIPAIAVTQPRLGV